MSEKIKAYKGFNNDWTCHGFQYDVGKTYKHEGEIALCNSGFHACENPLDVFSYYEAVPWTRFSEVELSGEILRTKGDSKIAATEIRIVRELSFNELIQAIKDSSGISESSGINGSFGVNESDGINESLFVSDVRSQPLLFNKPSTPERIFEVRSELNKRLNGWSPTFNNLKALYLKAGSKWEETPIPEAKELQKEEAWADVPLAAIDYLRSLPEFDAGVFEAVTGIKSDE